MRGSIDSYQFRQYNLMPMGDEHLFLPVKADIRKAIKKGAGDFVTVVLYHDHSAVEVPEELMECFDLGPKHLLDTFIALSDGEKKGYINWIYEAKREETQASRIAKMMDRLELGLGFYDHPPE